MKKASATVATAILTALLTLSSVSAEPAGKQYHNVSINTPAGPVQLSEVSFFQMAPGAIQIKGKVTNTTTKHWNVIFLSCELLDSAGKRIKVEKIEVPHLKPGEIRSIEKLSASYSQQKMDSFRFDFDGGSNPATYKFSLVKPVSSNDLQFTDADFELKLNPVKTGISLVLFNKSSEPMKVDWNNVSYIDPKGDASAVTREGVKAGEINVPLQPSIVPPSSRISATVVPKSTFTYYDFVGWIQLPFLPDAPKGRELQGKDFGLYIPIEVKGKIRNVSLTVHVDEVDG